jgi:hypothetical protein
MLGGKIMKAISTTLLAVVGCSSMSAMAAPMTYLFSGTLTELWAAPAPPEWQFAVGQSFSGELVYDPDLVASSVDYFSTPDWLLTFHNTPLVSLKFSIDIPGADYNYVVPMTSQYAAVARGPGEWNGIDLRTENYPDGATGEPSTPVPASAYVGPMNPHAVSIWLRNSVFYNPDAASLLPDTSADIDLEALHAGLIGPEQNTQFSVRFSDPGSWVPGVENLQGVLYGRIDLLRAVGNVPEPASWAMMIGGLFLTGGALRRRRIAFQFA